MEPLSFWAVVKLLLSLLPELISIVKSVIVWVNGRIDLAETKKKMQAMSAAISKAQETGDTSDVEAIFNPKP